jgi:hypothetical protein
MCSGCMLLMEGAFMLCRRVGAPATSARCAGGQQLTLADFGICGVHAVSSNVCWRLLAGRLLASGCLVFRSCVRRRVTTATANGQHSYVCAAACPGSAPLLPW